jgi:hypothetical protein
MGRRGAGLGSGARIEPQRCQQQGGGPHLMSTCAGVTPTRCAMPPTVGSASFCALASGE